jgi:hypothetical protein
MLVDKLQCEDQEEGKVKIAPGFAWMNNVGWRRYTAQ